MDCNSTISQKTNKFKKSMSKTSKSNSHRKKRKDKYIKEIESILLSKYIAMSNMNYIDEEYESFNKKENERSRNKLFMKKNKKIYLA